VDYPNSKRAKKYFLCLFAGASDKIELPRALTGEHHVEVKYENERRKSNKKRKSLKDKDWVLRKKELGRLRGKKVANDSKYTARNRGPKF
jgi:18S rRNA (guanine1575-N7)-methyltransferase